MASQTQGIQQLLAAEKRAAEKVSDARKRECIRRRSISVGGKKKYRSPPIATMVADCNLALATLTLSPRFVRRAMNF